jgi:hypothetical protein
MVFYFRSRRFIGLETIQRFSSRPLCVRFYVLRGLRQVTIPHSQAEFARVIKPGGYLVLVWYHQAPDQAQWVTEARELFRQHAERRKR